MTRRRNQNRQYQDSQGESYDNNMNQPGRNHGNNSHHNNRGRNNSRGNFGNNNGREVNHSMPNHNFVTIPQGGFPPKGPRQNVFQNNRNGWNQGPAHRNPPMNPPPSPSLSVAAPNPRYKGKNFDPNYRPQNPQNTPVMRNSRPGDFTHQNYTRQQLQQLMNQLIESTEQSESDQPDEQPWTDHSAHTHAGMQYEERAQFQMPQPQWPTVDSSGDWIMTNNEELSYMYSEFGKDVRLLLEGLAVHEGVPKIMYYMQQFEEARRGSPLAQFIHEMLYES